MQAMMTLNTLKVAEAPAAIKTAQESSRARGVQLVAGTILNPSASAGRGGGLGGVAAYTPAEQSVLEKGQAIYKEVCFSCHGEDGRGEAMPGAPAGTTRAPALAASPRVAGHQEYVIKTLLHGLTGPVNGTTYAEVMVPMGQSPDDWVAAVSSYIRNAFGNRAALIAAADVARVRAATGARKALWTTAELEASLPRLVVVDPGWKLSASHNNPTAADALTIRPWSTGRPQQAGMWLQVELPQAVALTEVEFQSSPVAPQDQPAVPGAPTRSGGGRGLPGAPAPAPPPQAFPRGYRVQVSMDGTTWSKPVAEGTGSGRRTDISFAPVRAKFVRITQTATDTEAPWSVERLRLYEAGRPPGVSGPR